MVERSLGTRWCQHSQSGHVHAGDSISVLPDGECVARAGILYHSETETLPGLGKYEGCLCASVEVHV